MSSSCSKFRLKYPNESIRVPASSRNQPSKTGATSSPFACRRPSPGLMSTGRCSWPASTSVAAAMHTAATQTRACVAPNRDVVLFISSRKLPLIIVEPGWRSVCKSPLSNLIQPLRELDRCAPGVGNERNGYVERGHLRIRTIELDAVRFEFLGEGLEIPDLEADVVDGTSRRPDHRIGRRCEVERDARQI